jgi:general secretion pathway protein G
MIEFILEILIDIGLLGADYKHRRKIRKKEKEDGVKRSAQKYWLQPSIIVNVLVFAIIIVILMVAIWYKDTFTFAKNTRKEMAEICDRAEEWKKTFGAYPTNLQELIGNNPLRQTWKLDDWNTPYRYKRLEHGILIVSAGSDKTFDTKDDIKSQ